MNICLIYASFTYLIFNLVYHNKYVNSLNINIYNYFINKNIFKSEFKLNYNVLITLYTVSILFKLTLINLGLYGVINTINDTIINIPFITIIIFISNLSTLIFFLFSLFYFKFKKNSFLFYFTFFVSSFFALISGFKFELIFIFIIILFSFYLINNRINKLHVILVVFAWIFSNTVITPYRNFIQSNRNIDNQSSSGILNSIIISNKFKSKNSNSDNFTLFKRISSTIEFVEILNYKKSNFDPDFKSSIITIPLQIITPRFLWKNKPKADLGRNWFNPKIFHTYNGSSRAFGPMGYLYLSGGVIFLIFGFSFIAILFQFINILLNSNFWGSKLVALGLLPSMINFESQFNFYIVGFFQLSLILIIIQRYILKK